MKREIEVLCVLCLLAVGAVAGTKPLYEVDGTTTVTRLEVTTIGGAPALANGETIDNETDGEVRVTYDDDAATLGTLALESDNAAASVADNDLFKLSATAYNSNTDKTEYISADLKITDVTDGTEDSQLVLNYLAGGAAKTVTIGATAAGAESLTVTTGDIQATAGTLLTGVGLDAVGAVDIDYGSADVTDHTFVTDGTGDAEIVLPADSIGEAELDSGNYTTLTFDAGAFDVVNTTQLVFIAAGVTNVIDADITN
jgi:hypothetical protein